MGVAVETQPQLTQLLVVDVPERVADVQLAERIAGVVIVELIESRRVRFRGLNLKPVARGPIAADLGRAFDAEARGFVVVVDGVGVLLDAIIPEQDGVILLAVKGHGDLVVALAHRSSLKLGNALLEIGAAIAPEIGGMGGRMPQCGEEDEQSRSAQQTASQTIQSPNHIPSPAQLLLPKSVNSTNIVME